jgi:hypothetical protein
MEDGDDNTGDAFPWPGGILSISASGTVVAGVAIERQDGNGAWVPIASLAHTAVGIKNDFVPAGPIRAVDTGGTLVYVYAMRVIT